MNFYSCDPSGLPFCRDHNRCEDENVGEDETETVVPLPYAHTRRIMLYLYTKHSNIYRNYRNCIGIIGLYRFGFRLDSDWIQIENSLDIILI